MSEGWGADLDRLLEDGEDGSLRRGATTVPCRIFVSKLATKVVAGNMVQYERDVILSPTGLVTAGWPDAVPVPVRGDKLLIQTKVHNIEEARGVFVDNVLVRINMRVLG